MHVNASLLFATLCLLHVGMNASRLIGYVKRRTRPGINMKWELAAAVALATAIFAGTYFEVSPINSFVDFKYQIRESWEQPFDGRALIPPRAASADQEITPRQDSRLSLRRK